MKYSILLFFLLIFLASSIQAAENSDRRVKRGEYIVTIAACVDCHSPKTITPEGLKEAPFLQLSGYRGPEKLPGIPRGVIGPDKWGGVFTHEFTAWAGQWGVSFAANLTPDKNTGLGLWTDEMFIKTIRTGKHLGTGRPILPPMPWRDYAKMTDEDLKAVFAYLQSLEPVKNHVPQPRPLELQENLASGQKK